MSNRFNDKFQVMCNYCNGSGRDELLYQDYTPTESYECPYCSGTGLDPSYSYKDEE